MEIIFRKYRRSGSSRSSRVYFDITTDCPPEDELKAAYEIQTDMGFPPGGYGGPQDVRVTKIEIAKDLGYVYQIGWWCFGSCE